MRDDHEHDSRHGRQRASESAQGSRSMLIGRPGEGGGSLFRVYGTQSKHIPSSEYGILKGIFMVTGIEKYLFPYLGNVCSLHGEPIPKGLGCILCDARIHPSLYLRRRGIEPLNKPVGRERTGITTGPGLAIR